MTMCHLFVRFSGCLWKYWQSLSGRITQNRKHEYGVVYVRDSDTVIGVCSKKTFPRRTTRHTVSECVKGIKENIADSEEIPLGCGPTVYRLCFNEQMLGSLLTAGMKVVQSFCFIWHDTVVLSVS